jgi:small subunit ribosomal protein S16
MVKIRLRRTGAKKKPHYRVVVADSRAPRDGRFIEIIGHYNPRTDPATVKVHEDRALHWLSVGAQPTDSVKKLLKNMGTLDKFARMQQGEDLEILLSEAIGSAGKAEPVQAMAAVAKTEVVAAEANAE